MDRKLACRSQFGHEVKIFVELKVLKDFVSLYAKLTAYIFFLGRNLRLRKYQFTKIITSFNLALHISLTLSYNISQTIAQIFTFLCPETSHQ